MRPNKPATTPAADGPRIGTYRYLADDPDESHYIVLRRDGGAWAGDYVGTGVADSTFYFKTPMLDLKATGDSLSFQLGEMDLYADKITPATDMRVQVKRRNCSGRSA